MQKMYAGKDEVIHIKIISQQCNAVIDLFTIFEKFDNPETKTTEKGAEK